MSPDLDVLERLAQARPTDLPADQMSPHAPAAQAMADRILARPRHGAAWAVPDQSHCRSRTWFLAAAALVAVAGTAAVAVAARRDGADRPDASASAPPLTPVTPETGRVEITSRTSYEVQTLVLEQTSFYEIAGDDLSLTLSNEGILSNRELLVDGEGYYQTLHPASENPGAWERFDPEMGSLRDFELWPATITERLSTLPDLVPVGDEEVRGVPTRHLRAAHPEAIDPQAHGLELLVSSSVSFGHLDIWLDADDQVRKVSYTVTGQLGDELSDAFSTEPGRREGFTNEVTVEVFDVGGPIDIEPPDLP